VISFLVATLLFSIVLLGMAVVIRDGDDDRPPVTRREIDRADRDRRPDIAPAIARDAARDRERPRAPEIVVVVVQPTHPQDDPRRWN
jgi:hypothetical protein